MGGQRIPASYAVTKKIPCTFYFNAVPTVDCYGALQKKYSNKGGYTVRMEEGGGTIYMCDCMLFWLCTTL
jgi:hypothetical protein